MAGEESDASQKENNENITNKSKSSEPISPNLSKQTASKQAQSDADTLVQKLVEFEKDFSKWSAKNKDSDDPSAFPEWKNWLSNCLKLMQKAKNRLHTSEIAAISTFLWTSVNSKDEGFSLIEDNIEEPWAFVVCRDLALEKTVPTYVRVQLIRLLPKFEAKSEVYREILKNSNDISCQREALIILFMNECPELVKDGKLDMSQVDKIQMMTICMPLFTSPENDKKTSQALFQVFFDKMEERKNKESEAKRKTTAKKSKKN